MRPNDPDPPPRPRAGRTPSEPPCGAAVGCIDSFGRPHVAVAGEYVSSQSALALARRDDDLVERDRIDQRAGLEHGYLMAVGTAFEAYKEGVADAERDYQIAVAQARRDFEAGVTDLAGWGAAEAAALPPRDAALKAARKDYAAAGGEKRGHSAFCEK